MALSSWLCGGREVGTVGMGCSPSLGVHSQETERDEGWYLVWAPSPWGGAAHSWCGTPSSLNPVCKQLKGISRDDSRSHQAGSQS